MCQSKVLNDVQDFTHVELFNVVASFDRRLYNNETWAVAETTTGRPDYVLALVTKRLLHEDLHEISVVDRLHVSHHDP